VIGLFRTGAGDQSKLRPIRPMFTTIMTEDLWLGSYMGKGICSQSSGWGKAITNV